MRIDSLPINSLHIQKKLSDLPAGVRVSISCLSVKLGTDLKLYVDMNSVYLPKEIPWDYVLEITTEKPLLYINLSSRFTPEVVSKDMTECVIDIPDIAETAQ
jgi:hypothetical protein